MYGYEGGDECPLCRFGRIHTDAYGVSTCNRCDVEFQPVNDEWMEGPG